MRLHGSDLACLEVWRKNKKSKRHRDSVVNASFLPSRSQYVSEKILLSRNKHFFNVAFFTQDYRPV